VRDRVSERERERERGERERESLKKFLRPTTKAIVNLNEPRLPHHKRNENE